MESGRPTRQISRERLRFVMGADRCNFSGIPHATSGDDVYEGYHIPKGACAHDPAPCRTDLPSVTRCIRPDQRLVRHSRRSILFSSALTTPTRRDTGGSAETRMTLPTWMISSQNGSYPKRARSKTDRPCLRTPSLGLVAAFVRTPPFLWFVSHSRVLSRSGTLHIRSVPVDGDRVHPGHLLHHESERCERQGDRCEETVYDWSFNVR